MIKAVVFDLDNTLVDFMAMKRRAIDADPLAAFFSPQPEVSDHFRRTANVRQNPDLPFPCRHPFRRGIQNT